MGALAILLAVQTAAAIAGFIILWRRLRATERETARLRALIEPMQARASGTETSTSGKVLRLPQTRLPPRSAVATARLSSGFVGGVVLASAAAAPALGFAFNLDHGWVVAAGYLVGAAMMMASLRQSWAVAAWAGVAAVGVWSVLGLALGVDLAPAAVALAGAGLSGVVHARLRALGPGGAMALMSAAALVYLSTQYGAVSVYGAALAALVVGAAVAGAHLRSEPVHLGAFVAALAGLFVLSGQDTAAVWFTPVATWLGALFFAIAAVRVPAAGARAATLAGTGMLAPLLAAGMLHRANHALAAPWAASAAFLVIAACSAILLAVTLRKHRPAKLGLTHWLLGLGAFAAFAIGVGHGFSASIATTAFAALALALTFTDERWPMTLWRWLANLAAIFAIAHGVETARSTLAEPTFFSPLLAVLAGPVAATCTLAFALRLTWRSKSTKPLTASMLEIAVCVLAMLAAHIALRLMFSDSAPVLKPIGFLEASAHISVWLVAALLIGARSDHPARTATALTMTLAAGAGAMVTGLLWFTPYWTERASAEWIHPALGFLLISICFWAQWALWRGRGEDAPSRATLAAAAFSMASAALLVLAGASFMADWLRALLSGLVVTLAIALNFAPGITAGAYDLQRFRRNTAAR